MAYCLFRIVKNEDDVTLNPLGQASPQHYERLFSLFRQVYYPCRKINATFAVMGYLDKNRPDHLSIFELNNLNGQPLQSSLAEEDGGQYLHMFWEEYLQDIPIFSLGRVCDRCGKVECFCTCLDNVDAAKMDKLLDSDFPRRWWKEWANPNAYQEGDLAVILRTFLREQTEEEWFQDRIGRLLDRLIEVADCDAPPYEDDDPASPTDEEKERVMRAHQMLLETIIVMLTQCILNEKNEDKLLSLLCLILNKDFGYRACEFISFLAPRWWWGHITSQVSPETCGKLAPALLSSSFLDSDVAMFLFDDIAEDIIEGKYTIVSGDEIFPPPTGVLEVRLKNSKPVPPHVVRLFLEKYVDVLSAWEDLNDNEVLLPVVAEVVSNLAQHSPRNFLTGMCGYTLAVTKARAEEEEEEEEKEENAGNEGDDDASIRFLKYIVELLSPPAIQNLWSVLVSDVDDILQECYHTFSDEMKHVHDYTMRETMCAAACNIVAVALIHRLGEVLPQSKTEQMERDFKDLYKKLGGVMAEMKERWLSSVVDRMVQWYINNA